MAVVLNESGVPSGQFSSVFLQGMISRGGTSFHKYGSAAVAKTDWIPSLETRLEKYKETGNVEWLMDVANYAMLEFMYPRHPEAHFRPTESNESPGHTMLDGSKEKALPRVEQEQRASQAYQREGD